MNLLKLKLQNMLRSFLHIMGLFKLKLQKLLKSSWKVKTAGSFGMLAICLSVFLLLELDCFGGGGGDAGTFELTFDFEEQEAPFKISAFYLDNRGTARELYNMADGVTLDTSYQIPRNAQALVMAVRMQNEANQDGNDEWIVVDYHVVINDGHRSKTTKLYPIYFPHNFNDIDSAVVVLNMLKHEEGEKGEEGEEREEGFEFQLDLFVNGQPIDREDYIFVGRAPLDYPNLGGEAARDKHNYILRDPLAAFNRLKNNNKTEIYSVEFSGRPNISTDSHHIQSYAWYDGWHIIGHSRGPLIGTDDPGIFYFKNTTTNAKFSMDFPAGTLHPGGMQVIGDYLVVPTQRKSEKSTPKKSPEVLLYDLTPLRNGNHPWLITTLFTTFGGEQSLGITDVANYIEYKGLNSDSYKGTHIAGVMDPGNNRLEIHIATGGKGLADSQYHWNFLGVTQLDRSHYDGMALVRDENHDIWMFGFFGEGSASFDARVHLYQLTQNANSQDGILKKQFNTTYLNHSPIGKTRPVGGELKLNIDHDSYDGTMWDISARWGTGFLVFDDRDRFLITVTERNLSGKNAATMNDFWSTQGPEPTKYTVTVNDNVGGISGTSGGGSYNKYDRVNINVSVPAGYIFKGWTTTSSGVVFDNANSRSTYFIIPDNAVTVTANFEPLLNTFTDTRDGQVYGSAIIGTQTWMTQNLNYKPASGTSWCYNEDEYDEYYCETYGRLYTWDTAMAGASSSSASPSGVQGVCPPGWHLPSYDELRKLADYAGHDQSARDTSGTKLKSPMIWLPYTGIPYGTDNYGFSALPGGFRSLPIIGFRQLGEFGYWWTATEFSANNAWSLRLSYDTPRMSLENIVKSFGYSVRCVKD